MHFMLSPFSKNSSYLKYTLYNNKIQNYILWQPGHHGYFTPQNLKEIWSRGFELEGLAEFNIQKINISNRSVYAYTKSTNLRSSIPNDESVGRQLMYTPIYNVKNIFTVRYKQFAFYNEYNLLSWRATSSDNYDYLPWYNLFNFGANFNINLKNNLLEINFALNNALNTSYEIIKNRPMPLRNFSISLNYTFTK
jgi:iron complex outermembrane receptor protein